MASQADTEQAIGARVCVVVLGDVGRSPRMQYHALALLAVGAHVDLIGHAGSALPRELSEHRGVATYLMRDDPPAQRHRLPPPLYLLSAAFRLLRQSAQLAWTLLISVPRPTFLLVQTPPALPTLPIVWLVARWRAVPLIIDWHNFGYAMLALRLGARHPVVRAARWLERLCGRRAAAHFCVSKAMQRQLETWGIDATVLYDRPSSRFSTPPAARRALLARLSEQLGGYDSEARDRPALVVSSTSWTADEDFSLLIDALVQYDARLAQDDGRPLPALLVVISGRGPLRAHYEAAFQQQAFHRVRARTIWLSAEDYPLLLGAADLGVSLHRSASGFDLPMKIADMLGAGLPVCALDYGTCLIEMIEPGVTGVLFATATELAERLCELLAGFPDDAAMLSALRRNVAARCSLTWTDGWRAEALPVFERLGLRTAPE